MSSLSCSSASVPFSRAPSETPSTHVSEKISTPPQSTFGKRPYSTLKTPVREFETTTNKLLLSPAFSSPHPTQQPFFKNHDLIHQSYFVYSGAYNSSSFVQAAKATRSFSENASEPFSESYDDSVGESFDEGFIFKTSSGIKNFASQKVKKQKKVRSDTRDSVFSSASKKKPPYSYATLIGMSILSHPGRQLTLSQIYSWISNTFKYYRREDVGWQNSIRHNLSLNKAFVKGKKSKDGKGHFWCIQPDSESLFMSTRNNKNNLCHETMDKFASAEHTYSIIPSSPSSLNDYDLLQDSAAKKNRLPTITVCHPVPPYPSDDMTICKQGTESQSIHHTPGRILTTYDSPRKPSLAKKSQGFTSSFSCTSNFESSPTPVHGTGPLLEPLSPKGNVLGQLPKVRVSQTNFHHQLQVAYGTPNTAVPTRTTQEATAKTPLRVLRTPLSSATLSKLRNSPSYLEEFYHSPFVASRAAFNSYDDDDMLLRAFDSPGSHQLSGPTLLCDLKKATLELADGSASEQ